MVAQDTTTVNSYALAALRERLRSAEYEVANHRRKAEELTGWLEQIEEQIEACDAQILGLRAGIVGLGGAV